MSILIFLIVSYILLSISLYFLFPKAGEEGWKGLVPGLNFVVWCKLIGRKPAHALLLLFPIVNIFIFCGMAVDMARSFKKYQFKHSALAVIYAPAMFFLLAFGKDEAYDGPTLIKEREYKQAVEEAKSKNQTRQYKKLLANNPYRKSAGREWVEAIVFAVFAAAFIRMFLIEAYKIPTPSMEGSLLVGDFLFVSKVHYGMRTPMTPAMIPLLHNRIPIIGGESYLESPSLPYKRLPALEKIDRNDPIVFNWPVGDSVYLTAVRSWTHGQATRRPEVAREVRGSSLITRPIDKKDHYIKRCIAVAGDSLQIIDRQVFINGEEAENPSNMQFIYSLTSNTPINRTRMDQLGIDADDHPYGYPNLYWMSPAQAAELNSIPDVKVEVVPQNTPGDMYPHNPALFGAWTNDNFGPIWIPAQGATIELNEANIALYKRVIAVYENNEFEVRNGQAYINGEKADQYTFQQDYYWAMGDNRHNSEDSRVWGFVPYDHIVGKPLFIWMSTGKNGIRWNRLLSSANKM